MTPPAPARIETLDVVRGFAILGILPVNAAFFALPSSSAINPMLAPQPVTPDTVWAWALVHAGFEMKMVTLFSMLFGISLFLVGGAGDDRDKSAALRRRLGWLGLFGLLHGVFIWYGDILFTYAIAGFIVMFARSWGARALLIAGCVLFAISVLLQGALSFSLQLIPADEFESVAEGFWDPGPAYLAEVVYAMRDGLASATLQNATEWLDYLWLLVLYLPRTIALMLIGLGLFKAGFFSARWALSAYAAIAAIGLGALAAVSWQTQQTIREGLPALQILGPGAMWNFIGSVAIALGYAALLILLVKFAALRPITAALANCGRLAFTNYLTQSLIMTTIFWSGRGFGLFGDVDRVGLWGIVVAIWVVQLVWSHLWLKAFSIGPFEWVWRSLTINGFAPLRR